ncbi:hypothetical protein JMN32_04590 [Fulvivirga sp. 29W222]|uniref:Squalene cyclase C-terminal domain-containing protein n=1 Tax=Fulvivirga marina TaxID=2494733 RepID=A0A937FV58_9BACT|nr:hypothetical protein [Fulvivirga marina]MBL6445573.1 hypothetical protein [Fulvivirga marina]
MMILKTFSLIVAVGGSILITLPTAQPVTNNVHYPDVQEEIPVCYTEKGCVFRTLFGEESSSQGYITNTDTNIELSIDKGLAWMAAAELSNGGWGAGSHYSQGIMDPHAVSADPATTAMVGMAFLRTGNTLQHGGYSVQLKHVLEYLLKAVESTTDDQLKITTETNTQIQTKLGSNIDAVLALQFFSNIVSEMEENDPDKVRVQRCMNICADKIQQQQDQDGSFKGSGWAGVLQSSLANNALESAEYEGADIDETVLERSRNYQKNNYDASSGKVNAEKGAGVVLYAVSGSVRASAKEARKVREEVDKAVKEGKLESNEPVTAESLTKIGYSEDEAQKYSTAYHVYESAKETAQEDRVIQGFGNNGGEEFLSYLQTGESLIINQDEDWKKWYNNVSGRLISIQNEDGSWNGHHCITSPVFCTATTLLTLSINNDVEKLIALGKH